MVHATWLNPAVHDVLPGDERAVDRVEGWFRQYAATRDPGIREQIIVAYLGLADRLAERYRSSRGASPEDLRQTARVGLVAAVDRYDPDYGNPFVPYAVACVVGEIKRYLRDTSWRIHVSRPVKERSLRVCKALDELPPTLGRSPTVAELAAYLAKQPMLFPSLGPSALLFFGRFPRPRSGAASDSHRRGGPPWHKTPSS